MQMLFLALWMNFIGKGNLEYLKKKKKIPIYLKFPKISRSIDRLNGVIDLILTLLQQFRSFNVWKRDHKYLRVFFLFRLTFYENT